MNLDYDLLNPIFDEDLLVQKERFGAELFADPIFQGFLQTIEMVIPEALSL
jgi:hypothetical protein